MFKESYGSEIPSRAKKTNGLKRLLLATIAVSGFGTVALVPDASAYATTIDPTSSTVSTLPENFPLTQSRIPLGCLAIQDTVTEPIQSTKDHNWYRVVEQTSLCGNNEVDVPVDVLPVAAPTANVTPEFPIQTNKNEFQGMTEIFPGNADNPSICTTIKETEVKSSKDRREYEVFQNCNLDVIDIQPLSLLAPAPDTEAPVLHTNTISQRSDNSIFWTIAEWAGTALGTLGGVAGFEVIRRSLRNRQNRQPHVQVSEHPETKNIK